MLLLLFISNSYLSCTTFHMDYTVAKRAVKIHPHVTDEVTDAWRERIGNLL